LHKQKDGYQKKLTVTFVLVLLMPVSILPVSAPAAPDVDTHVFVTEICDASYLRGMRFSLKNDLPF
jgi:hypothetical protein